MEAQAKFEMSLGYKFNRADLLLQALTHKSYANENSHERVNDGSVVSSIPNIIHGEFEKSETVKKPFLDVGDNERLEFLGDAVLDLVLSAFLMTRFPQDPEGGLSKKRASLVNEEILAQLAKELKIEQLMRLGRGELKTGGVEKPRILASGLEAVLGAVFLDGGFESAAKVIEKLFVLKLAEVASSNVDFHHDFKTRLQERAQELHRVVPAYKVEREIGPDHDKKFDVSVRIGESIHANGMGKSKKSAEQDAARQALELMK